MFFRSPDANDSGAKIPELTSGALTKLMADQLAAKTNLRTHAATMTDDEFTGANELLFKISEDIKAEKRNIERSNVEAAKVVERNKKLANVTNLLSSQTAFDAVSADKKATPEALTAATDALKLARETVENLILGSSAIKAVTTPGTGGGTKGAKSAEIVAMHIANKAKGMTDAESKKDIVSHDHAVGTVGSAILAWEREQGLKAAK